MRLHDAAATIVKSPAADAAPVRPAIEPTQDLVDDAGTPGTDNVGSPARCATQHIATRTHRLRKPKT
jgi:hypothetical protein